MRTVLLGIAAALALAPVAIAAQAPKIDMTALIARTRPSEGHALLQSLAGKWTVDKSTFVVSGTPEKPAHSSSMTTTREWIGDGKFLRDVTEGAMNGQPYFRTGLLGYNNMDRRYEWVTADNVTPTMMSYQGKPGSGASNPIVMSGAFTDLGVTGEANVGKNIPMRTVITIENTDRHTLEIYFTAPGQAEQLADRAIYTRVK